MIRTLRKELNFQLRHNRNQVSLWLLLALMVSGASGLLLWKSHWQELNADQNEQMQTQRGLLELRVNQHRTTVLDWGHWDTIHNFASGADPDFVKRELLPSSVITDRQVMYAVDPAGKSLILAGLSPKNGDQDVLNCIRQRLEFLRPLTASASADASFGLLCRVDGKVVVGAGTGIRPSSGEPPEQGWLFHLSAMERPSYNNSLNKAFAAINKSLVLSRGAVPEAALKVSAISELLPEGEEYFLLPNLSPLQVARRAIDLAFPSWFFVNLILLSLVPGALLLARQRRLPGRIRDVQQLRSERKRRHQISALLTNRRHLLMALDSDAHFLAGSHILAIQPVPATPADRVEGSSGGGESLVAQLILPLHRQLNPRVMTLMDPQTLLIAYEPAESTAAGVVEALVSLLHRLTTERAGGTPLACRTCITPLQPDHEVEQVLNLCTAVSRVAPDQPVAFLHAGELRTPASDSSAVPAEGSAVNGTDAAADADPEGGELTLEPVIRLKADRRILVYQQVRAEHPPPASAFHEATTHDHALRRDLALLRQVVAQLGQSIGAEYPQHYGVRIALGSLESDEHSGPMLQMLQALSEEQRMRLVIEITETDLMERTDHCSQRLSDLRSLGVRIGVAEFGRGHVPVQSLFAIEPNYLMLSSDYTHQIKDENIDGIVEFLVGYCRYHGCLLILEGVESRQQLLHWQRKGVTTFLGPYLASAAASAEPVSRSAGVPQPSGLS